MQTDTLFDVLFDKRRQEYLAETRELFRSYLHRPKQLKTNLFISFSSWPQPDRTQHNHITFDEHQTLFNAKNSDLQEGGYFLSLQEQGICINPGRSFFERACQKGYTLQDIDVVIATRPDRAIQEAIQQLYSLNRECSRTLTSYGQEPHIIRFFLHPELYANLSSLFRPMFREELSSVVSLETFAKSGETLALGANLSLSYSKAQGSALAIRIDAPAEEISFGFVAGGGYHEALTAFFSPCTILLSGIGECTAEDLEKVAFQKEALGYHGLVELIRSAPRLHLALVSEFSRSMGDIRLELVQKAHVELAQVELGNTAKIIPLDTNFCLHLDTLAVQTPNNTFCTHEECRIIRPSGPFGPLLFLGQDDVL